MADSEQKVVSFAVQQFGGDEGDADTVNVGENKNVSDLKQAIVDAEVFLGLQARREISELKQDSQKLKGQTLLSTLPKNKTVWVKYTPIGTDPLEFETQSRKRSRSLYDALEQVKRSHGEEGKEISISILDAHAQLTAIQNKLVRSVEMCQQQTSVISGLQARLQHLGFGGAAANCRSLVEVEFWNEFKSWKSAYTQMREAAFSTYTPPSDEEGENMLRKAAESGVWWDNTQIGMDQVDLSRVLEYIKLKGKVPPKAVVLAFIGNNIEDTYITKDMDGVNAKDGQIRTAMKDVYKVTCDIVHQAGLRFEGNCVLIPRPVEPMRPEHCLAIAALLRRLGFRPKIDAPFSSSSLSSSTATTASAASVSK